MTYGEVVNKWNLQADWQNQWDTFGEDEKIEFAYAAGREAMREEALKLALQWAKGREQLYGGAALTNYAKALRSIP